MELENEIGFSVGLTVWVLDREAIIVWQPVYYCILDIKSKYFPRKW